MEEAREDKGGQGGQRRPGEEEGQRGWGGRRRSGEDRGGRGGWRRPGEDGGGQGRMGRSEKSGILCSWEGSLGTPLGSVQWKRERGH